MDRSKEAELAGNAGVLILRGVRQMRQQMEHIDHIPILCGCPLCDLVTQVEQAVAECHARIKEEVS